MAEAVPQIAYRYAAKPAYQALGEYQQRVVDPTAEIVRSILHSPTNLVTDPNTRHLAMARALELAGIALGPYALATSEVLGKHLDLPVQTNYGKESEARKATEERLSQPGIANFAESLGLRIAADPLTYVGGVGAVRSGIHESLLKLPEEATLAEKLGTVIPTIGRELASQTGIPQIIRAPYNFMPFIGGAARAGRIGEGIELKNMAQAAIEELHNPASIESALMDNAQRAEAERLYQTVVDSVGATGDMTNAGMLARIKAKVMLPDLKNPKEQFVAAARANLALGMQDMSASDILTQSSRDWSKFGGSLMFAKTGPGTMADHLRQAQQAAVDLSAYQQAKLGRGLNPIERIISLVDPRIGANPAQTVVNTTSSYLEASERSTDVLGTNITRLQREVGLDSHPITDIVSGMKPAADGTAPTSWNIATQTSKFADQLNPDQKAVVKTLHQGIIAISTQVREYIQGIEDPAVRAAITKRMEPLMRGILSPDGSTYMHRMAILEGPENADITATNPLLRIAARLRFPTPLGPASIPGIRRLPGKQPETLIGRLIAQFYGPDEVIAREFNTVRTGVIGGIGTEQAFEKERTLGLGMPGKRVAAWSNRWGDMMKSYMDQVNHVLVHETITKPVLKSFGIEESKLVSTWLKTNKATLMIASNLNGQGLLHLGPVADGKASAKTANSIRSIADGERLPEPVSEALHTVAEHIDAHLDAEANAAKGTAEVIRKAESASGKLLTAAEARKAKTLPQAAQPARLTAAGEKLGETADVVGGTLPDIPIDYPTKRALKYLSPENATQAVPDDLAGRVAEVEAILKKTGQTATEALESGGLRQPGPPSYLEAAATAKLNMQNAAKDAIKLLEQNKIETRAALDEANQGIKAAIKGGTVFDMKQISGVSGLQGPWYDKQMAQWIENAYKGDSDSFLKSLTQAQGAIQSTTAGQSIHALFMQSIAAAAQNPVGWLKSVGIGLMSTAYPDVYAKYIASKANVYDAATGKSLLQLMDEAGLAIGPVEVFSPTQMGQVLGVASSNRLSNAVGSLSGIISRMPLNRAFTMQRNVASVEMFRAELSLQEALGTKITPEALTAIGHQINLATGYISTTELGLTARQNMTERLLGRFGVQWFRSQTARILNATSVGTLDGAIARRLLVQQMGAMSALYVAAAAATGQKPDFDPTSRNFLSVQVHGSRVAFGGVYVSLMRAMGKTVEAVATGNEGDLIDIHDGKNPLLNFWKSGAPLVGKMLADTVQIDAHGNPLADRTSYAKFPLGELAPGSVLPIDVQAGLKAQGSLLDRAIAAAPAAIGLRDTPLTVTDIFAETSNQFAKEHGAVSWADIPKATQDRYLADPTNTELKQAADARDQWFADHSKNTPLDAASTANQRSIQAEGDVLTGLATQVNAGTMSLSAFRQAYNDWTGKHTYFTGQLYGALPADDAAKLKNAENTGTRQDILSAKYEAIQPVDTTGTGTPSEADWATWKTAQDKFWVDNPEANNFRQYITVDYPLKKWSAFPLVLQQLTALKAAQTQNTEYLNIPKYKGMSVAEGQFMDSVLSDKNAAVQELTLIAIQQGVPEARVKIPSGLAWRYAISKLQDAGFQATDRQVQLIKLAAVIDGNQKAKLQIINPGRLQYLQQNPSLMDWYPSAAGATGIPTKILEALGLLTSAPGESVATKSANIVSVNQ